VRPGLREALAACRTGYTLVVTKLDRLPARAPTPATSSMSSLPTASIGLHDPADPVDRLLFTVISMIAEVDLARARTREGLAIAKAKGRLRGTQPMLKSTRFPAHVAG